MTNDYGMLEIQSRLLDAIKSFDLFCKENDIVYSLQAGSLLGAVREHGFIPWDDDIDISMNRENYEKLRMLLSANNETCFSFEYKRDKLKKVWFKDTEGNTVWFDIVIWDYISENHIIQKIKKTGIKLLSAMTKTTETMTMFRTNDRAHGISKYIYEFLYAITKRISIEKRMELFDNYCKKMFVGSRKYIFAANDQLIYMPITVNKEAMEKCVPMTFEDTELLVSKDYKEILSKMYGKDYMTPRRAQASQEKVHEMVRNQG